MERHLLPRIPTRLGRPISSYHIPPSMPSFLLSLYYLLYSLAPYPSLPPPLSLHLLQYILTTSVGQKVSFKTGFQKSTCQGNHLFSFSLSFSHYLYIFSSPLFCPLLLSSPSLLLSFSLLLLFNILCSTGDRPFYFWQTISKPTKH